MYDDSTSAWALSRGRRSGEAYSRTRLTRRRYAPRPTGTPSAATDHDYALRAHTFTRYLQIYNIPAIPAIVSRCVAVPPSHFCMPRLTILQRRGAVQEEGREHGADRDRLDPREAGCHRAHHRDDEPQELGGHPRCVAAPGLPSVEVKKY